MIKGIAHICIGALDLAATERFYCAGLGMTKGFNFLRKGQVIGFYLKAADGVYVEVFKNSKIVPQPDQPISHLCLEVSDIDETVARLKANGYDVTAKLLGADRSWQAWVTDPAGVRIEFHQYTAKSSQLTGADCILE